KVQANSVTPSASIQQDSITYLASKIGIWSLADAEVELGKPFARRDGTTGGVVCCDVFRYYSPTSTFRSIELSIHRGSKKVVAVYFHYSASVSWKDIEQSLGRNYNKTKLPGGQSDYLYN